tara:strand:+ start:557 stop:1291 length:735 start_codon:yes stop_codon:yes gene_type:complete
MDTYTVEDLKPIDNLTQLQSLIFGLLDCTTHIEFSDKLCKLHEKNPNIAGELQDKVINSKLFLQLINDGSYKKLAAKILKTSVDDVKIIFPFFRIDLPSKFRKDHEKMSLPWHQEAGYYLEKGNCTPRSIVMSTYLHECKTKEGALEVSSDPHVEFINHSTKFKDDFNKKFLRVTCPAPKNFISVETKFGKVISFDFLRPHRSGLNQSSLVRLTCLLRVTSLLDLKNWNSQNYIKTNSNEKDTK